MRKARLLATTAALATALAMAPATPAHAAGGPAYAYSTTGLGAVAVFSDLPESGPVARTVYHDTFVNAGQQATRADGTKSNGSYAFISQVSYSFDRRGNFVFLSESFGFADGAAVTYTADRKLTAAAVAATIPVETCDASWNCTSGGSTAVEVSWSGVGAVSKYSGTQHYQSDGIHYTARFSGSFRSANATGFGSAVWAELNSGTSSERCIGSGC